MNEDMMLDKISEEIIDIAFKNFKEMGIFPTEDLVKGFATGYLTAIESMSEMIAMGIKLDEIVKGR